LSIIVDSAATQICSHTTYIKLFKINLANILSFALGQAVFYLAAAYLICLDLCFIYKNMFFHFGGWRYLWVFSWR